MKKIKEFLNKKYENKTLKIIIDYFLFPLFLLMLSDFYFKMFYINGVTGFTGISIFDIFIVIFNNPLSFIFSYILLIIINAIFVSIFNNKWNKIIPSLILLIFLVINDIKITIMGDPLYISDINFLNADNEAMMGAFFESVFGIWLLKVLLKIIIYVFLVLIFITLDNKLKNFIIKKIYKILIPIISLILIVIPFVLNDKEKNFIIEKIYNTTFDNICSTYILSDRYYEYGFIEGIYLMEIKDISIEPNDYNKEETKNQMENLANEVDTDKWGNPNVIYILSESLSNFDKISGDEITFNKDLFTYLNKLKKSKNVANFNTQVTVYGGQSVNTEFQVLTGASLNLWPSGFIPYYSLYNNKNGNYLPNIITEYNNNGYLTEYITPWGNTSYRSEYVYNLFKVGKKTYGDDLIDSYNKGNYVSDEYLMNYVYDELTKTNEKKFLFVATGQNHGPYSSKYNEDELDIEITSSIFNENDNKLLLNYAQGVYDASKSVYELYQKILKLDEPTIIVFYGDHLPYIVNTEGENVYLKQSYFSDDADKMYTTPVYIMANYNIDLSSASSMNISYLGAYLLNHLDLEISDYFKYIYYNYENIPIFNRTYKNDLINLYKNVQYYNFYDYEN